MGSQCHKIRIICQAFFNLNARFVRWSAAYGSPSFSAPLLRKRIHQLLEEQLSWSSAGTGMDTRFYVPIILD
jgi:hypothetical protein